MTNGNARRSVGVVNRHCEWMAHLFACAHPRASNTARHRRALERMCFERRVARTLSRVTIGVRSVRSSNSAIGLPSSIALRAAASMARARSNAVLASAPHAVSEQKYDSRASHARVRAAPLLPSIHCPPRQSLQATVVGSFRPLFHGPGQNDVAETTQYSEWFASPSKTKLSCNRFHGRTHRFLAVQHSGSSPLQCIRVYLSVTADAHALTRQRVGRA